MIARVHDHQTLIGGREVEGSEELRQHEVTNSWSSETSGIAIGNGTTPRVDPGRLDPSSSARLRGGTARGRYQPADDGTGTRMVQTVSRRQHSYPAEEHRRRWADPGLHLWRDHWRLCLVENQGARPKFRGS